MPLYNNVKTRFNAEELDPCLAAEVRIKKDLVLIRNFRQSKCLLCIVLTLLTIVLLISAFMMIFYSGYFSSSLSSIFNQDKDNRIHSLYENNFDSNKLQPTIKNNLDEPQLLSSTIKIFYNKEYNRKSKSQYSQEFRVIHESHEVRRLQPINIMILKNHSVTVDQNHTTTTTLTTTTTTSTPASTSSTTLKPITIPTLKIEATLLPEIYTEKTKTSYHIFSHPENSHQNNPTMYQKVLPAFPMPEMSNLPIASGKQHCDQYRQAGFFQSGIYNLSVPGFTEFSAFCLLNNDYGWTIWQRRTGPKLPFWNATFEEYENGFGELNDDHWLGLEKVYSYFRRNYELQMRIVLIGDLCPKNMKKCSGLGEEGFWWGDWDFTMAGKEDFYKLSVLKYLDGNLSSTISVDYFESVNKGQPFSTVDMNNSNFPRNGALYRKKGAWWHKDHTFVSLNGLYSSFVSVGEGQSWYWANGKNKSYNIKPMKSLMMFRIKE